MAEEEKTKERLESEIADLRDQLVEKRAESEMEQKRKDGLDRDLKELNVAVEDAARDLESKKATMRDNTKELQRLDGKLDVARNEMEKYLKQYDTIFQRTNRLT